jgi:hypothetical protein
MSFLESSYIFRKGPVDLGTEEEEEVEQTQGYGKL